MFGKPEVYSVNSVYYHFVVKPLGLIETKPTARVIIRETDSLQSFQIDEVCAVIDDYSIEDLLNTLRNYYRVKDGMLVYNDNPQEHVTRLVPNETYLFVEWGPNIVMSRASEVFRKDSPLFSRKDNTPSTEEDGPCTSRIYIRHKTNSNISGEPTARVIIRETDSPQSFQIDEIDAIIGDYSIEDLLTKLRKDYRIKDGMLVYNDNPQEHVTRLVPNETYLFVEWGPVQPPMWRGNSIRYHKDPALEFFMDFFSGNGNTLPSEPSAPATKDDDPCTSSEPAYASVNSETKNSVEMSIRRRLKS